jgi:hypothetical protein
MFRARRQPAPASLVTLWYHARPVCAQWDTPSCLTGTPTMYHWNTDRAPLGHRPCTTGTPAMYHWDTDHVPLGHRPCTTGTPAMYHWDNDHVPLGHRPCTTGTATMYHWDIDDVPLGQRPCLTEPIPVVAALHLAAHVRTHRVARIFCASPHCPLTSRFNGPISFPTTSNFVRFSALAAVGGTGVLNKHIRPVPARELS